MKIDLADAKVFARFNLFDAILERRRATARFFVADAKVLADVGLASLGGDVDRAIDHLQEHAQPAHMIAVLVSDHYAVEAAGIFANQRQPAHQFARAQAGVNQHASLTGNNQHRVAG